MADEEDAEAHHQIGQHETPDGVQQAQLLHAQIKRDHIHFERNDRGGEDEREDRVDAGEAEFRQHVARDRGRGDDGDGGHDGEGQRVGDPAQQRGLFQNGRQVVERGCVRHDSAEVTAARTSRT